MTKPQKAILGWSATITGLICFGIFGYTIYDRLPPPLPPQPPQQFEDSQPPQPPPKQTRKPRQKKPPKIPAHLHDILASGIGHDFMALSVKERLQLCQLCVQQTRRHSISIYFDFISEFYFLAKEQNQQVLTTPISEVVAVAAAFDYEDE